MTEPPRPPDDVNPYSNNDPTSGSTPPPPPYGAPQPPPYSPPPSSGAPGYGPPPGAYGPPPGAPQYGDYQPGPGQSAPAGFSSEDDKTWALVAHFGGAILAFVSGGWLGWVAPLIALLGRGSQSPVVRRHAVQALNFQLLWAVVALAITIVSGCLSIIVIGLLGFFFLAVPWIMGTVFGIIAGVKALNGEPYNYPATPNWVK